MNRDVNAMALATWIRIFTPRLDSYIALHMKPGSAEREDARRVVNELQALQGRLEMEADGG